MFPTGNTWSHETTRATKRELALPTKKERGSKDKEDLAVRKRKERAHMTGLWAKLELLAPNVDENKAPPGYRSKALQGRAKDELLKDIMHAVRLARGPLAPAAITTQTISPGALQQAYTTQAGAGLIAIELKSGKIAHQSPSFESSASWIPTEARGNIRVALEAGDGNDFHSFCQQVVRDAGEPCEETFLDRDKVVGRAITVRFLSRATGPPDLRNPEWLLMMRTVKLTLVGVQPRQLDMESPAAGRRLPFLGRARVPEAVGVFTADLSGGTPSQWTVQAAHIRNLVDSEVAPGNYDLEVGNMKPLETLAMLFNFDFTKKDGGGASLFSRAAAHLEQAATSALNMAQRSFSWLTSKALRITHQLSCRLNDDDTVLLTTRVFYKLVGGLSTSISMDFVCGKVQFSHGGLDFLYFIADPEQPLDANLRAAWFRINGANTAGEFDVHRPFVATCLWGGGRFHFLCAMLSLDMMGRRVSSLEDVSQLFEKIKTSPGRGLLSNGTVSICVGESNVTSNSPDEPW